MNARPLKTPSGKMFWLLGAGNAETVSWDDDVADVAVTFLNMNEIDPMPRGNAIMRGPNFLRAYPAWARHLLAQMSPLLARAVLTQCEALPASFLLLAGLATRMPFSEEFPRK